MAFRRSVAQAEATQELSAARAFLAATTQARAEVAQRASRAEQSARTTEAEKVEAESVRKVRCTSKHHSISSVE